MPRSVTQFARRGIQITRLAGRTDTPVVINNTVVAVSGESQHQHGDEIVTVRPQGRFRADNGTALVAAAVAGLGIAWLPDGLIHQHITSGTLVVVMTRYPPPAAGIYAIRPPGQHPARKVRILTEMLIECFEHLQPAGMGTAPTAQA